MEDLFPLVLSRPAALDRHARQALVHQANQITRTGDIHRVALDEMTLTYIAAKQMIWEALTIAEVLRLTTPGGELADAAHVDLTQEYLQSMVAVLRSANQAIQERANDSSA